MWTYWLNIVCLHADKPDPIAQPIFEFFHQPLQLP